MPKDKDLKRIVRERMGVTGERYTTARLAITGPLLDQPDLTRRARLDALVQLMADKHQRIDAIVELLGGVTATDLRNLPPLAEDAFEALVRGLADPKPPVRWWCIQLLDHVPDPRALAAVARLLEDPVPRVRRNAVHALGCVACKPDAADQLPAELLDRIAAMADDDPNRKVRAEAAYALACRTGARFRRHVWAAEDGARWPRESVDHLPDETRPSTRRDSRDERYRPGG
jgi:hypothetical protein